MQVSRPGWVLALLFASCETAPPSLFGPPRPTGSETWFPARGGSAACSISANASQRVAGKRSPAHDDRRYRNATAAVVRARYSFSGEQSCEGSATASRRSSRPPPLLQPWQGSRLSRARETIASLCAGRSGVVRLATASAILLASMCESASEDHPCSPRNAGPCETTKHSSARRRKQSPRRRAHQQPGAYARAVRPRRHDGQAGLGRQVIAGERIVAVALIRLGRRGDCS